MNVDSFMGSIHAIILTHDRPRTLQRCIATAVSSLGDTDILTVVDDSAADYRALNAHLLASVSCSRHLQRIYLSISDCQAELTEAAAPESLLWFNKTAPRDIAPLRNLSLLLSRSLNRQTTILIDDDIHGFDLAATKERTRLLGNGRGFIAGADIGGVSELDIVTRLSEAVDRAIAIGDNVESFYRDLFKVQQGSNPLLGHPRRYASAGYLAFRLPEEPIVGFPPGYNEDWLWCLIYAAVSEIDIVSLGEVVLHDPPAIRRLSHTDLLFELIGDVVFDSIEDRSFPKRIDAEAVLMSFYGYSPQREWMPSARVLEVLEKAMRSQLNGGFSILEEYGLRDLSALLEKGALNLDGARLMSDWSLDAVAKQRSIATILQDRNAMAVLNRLCQEGTI